MKIEVFEENNYASSAASYILESILAAENNEVLIALCGGSTPKPIYQAIAKALTEDARFTGKKLKLFLGDERFVPLTDSRSNYKMIMESGLGSIEGKSEVLPLDVSLANVEAAALSYEKSIALLGRPFDLMLLGIGDDGHTASLFPGQNEALHEEKRMCISVKHPTDGTERMSFTFPLLQNATKVFFLAKGSGKASILNEVIKQSYSVETYPSSFWKRCQERVSFLIDTPAAALL